MSAFCTPLRQGIGSLDGALQEHPVVGTMTAGSLPLPTEQIDVSPAEIDAELQRLNSRELRLRRLSLSLAAPLESIWREHHAKGSIRLIQGAIALTFVFYSAYWLTMSLGYAPQLDRQLVLIFVMFGTPGNTALMITTFLPNGWKYLRRVCLCGVVLHTFGMYLFFRRGDELGIDLGSELVILQILYALFLLGLMWRDAALMAFLALLVAPIAGRTATNTDQEAMATVFFIAAAAVVGSLGSYMAERTQRIAWLRERLIASIAERDTLTTLLNHGAFYARAERVMAHARRSNAPVSVLALDVDHFKALNDAFGHPAGDECLRQVGAAIAAEGRRPLDLAGRIGGEEFALLLYDATPAQALDRAEAVRARIGTVLKPDGIPLTVSIGVEHAGPQGHLPLETLIARADALLYEAKATGRDRVVESRRAANDARASTDVIPLRTGTVGGT